MLMNINMQIQLLHGKCLTYIRQNNLTSNSEGDRYLQKRFFLTASDTPHYL